MLQTFMQILETHLDKLEWEDEIGLVILSCTNEGMPDVVINKGCRIKIMNFLRKKTKYFRIRETLTLLTNADSITIAVKKIISFSSSFSKGG